MRTRITRRTLTSLALVALLAGPASAQVPTTLSYQGRLLENTANQGPASGSVDIVFSIWSGPNSDGAATQLWSETWTGVALSNGVFSVLLGSNGSPLVPADFQGDSSLYLQLEINGETMTPRQQLGSVPFAIVDEPANERQSLELVGDTLGLSDSAATVDLSPYLDDMDAQDLELTGTTLSLTNDPTSVDLSTFLDNTDNQVLSLNANLLQLTSDDGIDAVPLTPYLDNTDNQALSLAGNNLNLTSDDGTDTVSLAGYLDNTDSQTLGLSGTNLSISGGNSVSLSTFTNTDGQTLSVAGSNLAISGGNTVSLAAFLDNTDSQNLNSVLSLGNDANNRDITNVDRFDANDIETTNFTCSGCIDTADIANDTIGGNDIQDNIFILHVDCNGSCANMSMRDSCNVIENLRGLDVEVELIGVSCVHGIPSTTGNGFVPCDDGTEVFGAYECRAFNLRTLGDLPCINDDGTDVIVTCLQTDIPK